MGRIMNNVTKMELYKVLSKPQVYIIFVVGLIIQSIMAGQMRTTMFNGYHKSVYENYMNEMEGEYSIEKKETILIQNIRNSKLLWMMSKRMKLHLIMEK